MTVGIRLRLTESLASVHNPLIVNENIVTDTIVLDSVASGIQGV
jgi:hypothetical protein